MIISQTPLRVSFAGGGSDLPSYYRDYGGCVVSTAIDKYVYVTVSRKFDESLRVSYSRTEEVRHVAELNHPIVREAIKMMSIQEGLEITSIADIPSKGTGLGSSSSFSVGLMHALHAIHGRHVSAKRLAEEACLIEIEKCGEPIGKQDQYAAAHGGFNYIEFMRDGTVQVDPIILSKEQRDFLGKRFMMFFTGCTRSASEILAVQARELSENMDKLSAMHRMVELARELRDELHGGNLDAMGRVLHENWLLKQSLAPGITNHQINEWYERAMDAGALGGKLLGAGGGGFLLFYVPQEAAEHVRRALKDIREFGFTMERRGSRIIFVND